jgi:hypothetical protein
MKLKSNSLKFGDEYKTSIIGFCTIPVDAVNIAEQFLPNIGAFAR